MTSHSFLEQTLRHLALDLQRQQTTSIKDAPYTVRFVGEFSSGKSRVMREIFSPQIPFSLLPRSELQAETLLPLEMTYGTKTELVEIKRKDDFSSPEKVRSWTSFPRREEIDVQAKQNKHRLVLTLPLEALQLDIVDQETKILTRQRLRLIDTAGWNAGDEDDTFSEIESSYPYAVVYVVTAHRLECSNEETELKTLFEALEISTLPKTIHFLVFVTRWEEEQPTLRDRFEKRILQLGQEYLSANDFRAHFFYQDFSKMSDAAKEQMRQRFWAILTDKNILNSSLNKANPPKRCELPIDLILHTQIPTLKNTFLDLRASAQSFLIEGKPFPHWNLVKLAAYQPDIKQMLWKEWQKRLKLTSQKERAFQRLPQEHPLAFWWNQDFLMTIEAAFRCYLDLLQSAEEALRLLEKKILQKDQKAFDINEYLLSLIGQRYHLFQEKITLTSHFFLPSIVSCIERWEKQQMVQPSAPSTEELQRVVVSLLFVGIFKEGLAQIKANTRANKDHHGA